MLVDGMIWIRHPTLETGWRKLFKVYENRVQSFEWKVHAMLRIKGKPGRYKCSIYNWNIAIQLQFCICHTSVEPNRPPVNGQNVHSAPYAVTYVCYDLPKWPPTPPWQVANGAVNAIKMSDRPSSATVPFIIAAQKPQPQPLGVHTETARAPSPLVCAVSCSEHLTVCTLYAPSFRHTRLNVNDAVDHAYYNIWTFTAHAHTQTYDTKSPTKKTVRTRQTWRVNMHANESTATRMGSVGRYQGALCMCTISRRPWPWHTFCDAPKYERAREREQEQANTSETYIQDSTNTIVNKMPDTSSLSWLFCVFQCVCCCVWSCA